MTARLKHALRAVLVGAVVATPFGVTALAYADPYASSEASVSTSTPAPGSPLTVRGSGFRGNSTVTIEIHSDVQVLATVTADANGDAAATVTVPSDLAAGESHVISLVGVDPSGAPRVESVTVTLAGGPATNLPFTGVDVVPAAAAAAGLVGFGAFVTFASRRKRAAQLG